MIAPKCHDTSCDCVSDVVVAVVVFVVVVVTVALTLVDFAAVDVGEASPPELLLLLLPSTLFSL